MKVSKACENFVYGWLVAIEMTLSDLVIQKQIYFMCCLLSFNKHDQ